MAAGGQDSPSKEVEILFEFQAWDFGPLNLIDEKYIKTFSGGKYFIVTPKNKLKLYRLHGGNANEIGQFWSPKLPEGKLGFRIDAAIQPQWNDLDKSNVLFVPPGVYLYEGRASRQGNLVGGGWQVFIPQEVLNNLVKIQPNSGARESECKQAVDNINRIQKHLMEDYEKQFNEMLQQRALKQGSEFGKLSPEVQKILRDEGKSEGKITEGKYLLHKDSIPVSGGKRKNISVWVRIEFVRSETRTYQAGKTIVTETTNYFNRITEITETIS